MDPPPWVRHLKDRGFTADGDSHFTRESTAVRIADNRIVIESPPGTPVWSLDLTGTDEMVAANAVRMLLQFRPSLVPPQGIDAEVEEMIVERALCRIEGAVSAQPQDGLGTVMRRFLWGLCNEHHRTHLLHTVPIMDPVRSECMATVRAAALLGRVSLGDIKAALRRAGEIQDLEDEKPCEQWAITVDEVLLALTKELQRPLPDSTVEALHHAVQALTEARDALRSTEKPHRRKTSTPE